MEYTRVTNKTEAVEADSPEEAQTKEGKTIDIQVKVSPRVVPATPIPTRLVSPALAKHQG